MRKLNPLASYTDIEIGGALRALRNRLKRPVEGLTDDERKLARTRLRMAAMLDGRSQRRAVRKWLADADEHTRDRIVRLLNEAGVST